MQSLTDDIQSVRLQLRDWHARMDLPSPGVPIEMRIDPASTEEWQQWKLIDVSYTLNDVELLEAKLPVKLPQYFKAFMLSYHTLQMDFGDYSLPESWCDRALEQNFDVLLCSDFWELGYLLIGSALGCGDPLLLDFHSITEDRDYSVTYFNHDVVLPLNAHRDRVTLKPYLSFLAPSFREFFGMLMTEDARIFPAPISPEDQRRNKAWKEVEQLLAEKGLPRYHRPKEVPSIDPWAIAAFLRADNSA